MSHAVEYVSTSRATPSQAKLAWYRVRIAPSLRYVPPKFTRISSFATNKQDGAPTPGVPAPPKLFSDVVEALAGAVFLDGGEKALRRAIGTQLGELVQAVKSKFTSTQRGCYHSSSIGILDIICC